MEREYLITKLNDPNEIMPTQYGTITFREWLVHEQKRLAALGRRTQIIKRNSRLALAYS